MSASHFRELEVWQAAMSLTKVVYAVTASFPGEHRFGLSSQLQRAAVSIPSNIAEGNARASTRDYARFVSIACGSAAEIQTQLLLAQDLDLAERSDLDSALAASESVSKMLHALLRALQAKLEPRSPVPGPRSRISEPAEDYQ